MRGPQPVVHDLLRKPAHYRRRLQHYSCSQRAPKWDEQMRPRFGTTPKLISPNGLVDQRFTWRGPTSQSRLDQFLCSIEILERFPFAEETSLLHPLFDHTPLLWSSQVETEKPPYFKLDRSWLCDAAVKASIEEWWDNQILFGLASERVPKKLIGLHLHLLSIRRQIRADRTRAHDASLACIQALDIMEDSRPLTAVEAYEPKKSREDVAEVDRMVEMDWWQRSRQLWLAARDANTKFFHHTANGRRWSHRIGRL